MVLLTSSMIFLKKSNLIGSGHEDGKLRLWNFDVNSSITLDWYSK